MRKNKKKQGCEKCDDEMHNILYYYVDNLNEEALRFALLQVLKYPETREFIIDSAREFEKVYRFRSEK